MLNPTIVVSHIMAIAAPGIGLLQLFTHVVNLKFNDRGGPLGSTLTVVPYVYQRAFQAYNMGYVAAITVVFVSVPLFDSLAGYVLAKLSFSGKNFVFLLILSTLFVPTEMLVLPWYQMSAQYGWLNTYWGILFPGVMTAFGVFLMRQAFSSLPVGLSRFSGEAGAQWNLITTGSAVAVIPMMIAFAVFQRQIIEGVVRSGLK